jgi:hypothetical protein
MRKDQAVSSPKPHLHSAPAEVAAAHNLVKSAAKGCGGDYDFKILQRQHNLKQSSEKNHDANRHRVAESNRRQRTDDCRALFSCIPRATAKSQPIPRLIPW